MTLGFSLSYLAACSTLTYAMNGQMSLGNRPASIEVWNAPSIAHDEMMITQRSTIGPCQTSFVGPSVDCLLEN